MPVLSQIYLIADVLQSSRATYKASCPLVDIIRKTALHVISIWSDVWEITAGICHDTRVNIPLFLRETRAVCFQQLPPVPLIKGPSVIITNDSETREIMSNDNNATPRGDINRRLTRSRGHRNADSRGVWLTGLTPVGSGSRTSQNTLAFKCASVSVYALCSIMSVRISQVHLHIETWVCCQQHTKQGRTLSFKLNS